MNEPNVALTGVIWTCSFLLGSIPFGLLIAKLKNIDIRQEGSGNIGATNVARTLGRKAGILTLVGDCGKGYLACWLAAATLGTAWQIAVAGLLAFLGHVFSLFLKFKGGKGIATGLGIYLFLMPAAAGGGVLMFILLVALTGYVSVGSLAAAVTIPVLGWAFSAPSPYIAVAGVAAGLTFYKHKDNLVRLRAGTESKFLKK
ncbi:glycerol-3-phosphate 1-O-acyltransferase PlsY [Nitrospina gracilis]|uniref:glycerol-3-phosphate 1-O-acyltransferase PlsY n=1 Tax=Nitrospina gracilis TaxID=35801 RepID=UPI001F02B6FD|nr:glycerol-3-phosphate 1-O-acyltransferase PlsY [Nitrospina gracilis]MCF8721239.1 glycerol-3-phosphate acyltransferase PlsY [Nitrospina gracilis Nb-211]